MPVAEEEEEEGGGGGASLKIFRIMPNSISAGVVMDFFAGV